MDDTYTNNYLWKRAVGTEGVLKHLYKFYPIRISSTNLYNHFLLDSISNKYLWHSDPKSFNDPFDCYQELIGYSNPSKAFVQDFINRHYVLPRKSRREEMQYLNKNPKLLIAAFRASLPKFRTCSFSKEQVSNTMWSHYANCHTGLCLMFDNNELIKREIFVHKVTYESEFVSTNIFTHETEALLNLITTKSAEWAYEKEYRNYTVEQEKVYFGPKCLVGVTFGCKTSREDILFIQTYFNSEGYENLEWYQAKMQKRSFNMIIEPLN